jgi:hypothetical protein
MVACTATNDCKNTVTKKEIYIRRLQGLQAIVCKYFRKQPERHTYAIELRSSKTMRPTGRTALGQDTARM